jgi:hypothetical protein
MLWQETTSRSLSVGHWRRRGEIDTCALGVPQHGATEDAQAQAAHARSVWAGGLNIRRLAASALAQLRRVLYSNGGLAWRQASIVQP